MRHWSPALLVRESITNAETDFGGQTGGRVTGMERPRRGEIVRRRPDGQRDDDALNAFNALLTVVKPASQPLQPLIFQLTRRGSLSNLHDEDLFEFHSL